MGRGDMIGSSGDASSGIGATGGDTAGGTGGASGPSGGSSGGLGGSGYAGGQLLIRWDGYVFECSRYWNGSSFCLGRNFGQLRL
jgi:hypothetical protein